MLLEQVFYILSPEGINLVLHDFPYCPIGPLVEITHRCGTIDSDLFAAELKEQDPGNILPRGELHTVDQQHEVAVFGAYAGQNLEVPRIIGLAFTVE